jgi:hypothetical protein
VGGVSDERVSESVCGSAGVRECVYLRDAKTANVVPHTNKAYAFYNRLKTTSVNTVKRPY